MNEAVVVFSGGQDSTTCLVWARERFDAVTALTFDYGQRHAAEIIAAQTIADRLRVPHRTLDLRAFGDCVPSALTRPTIHVDRAGGRNGLPSTFAPGRNLVFLTMAASYAISHGIHSLVTGVCQTDYSGYPDCRHSTITTLEDAIRLGTDDDEFRILTPLMYLTKRETVELARDLGAIPLLGDSHTCYLGKRPACGRCPACVLRLKGFLEAGIPDPLPYEGSTDIGPL